MEATPPPSSAPAGGTSPPVAALPALGAPKAAPSGTRTALGLGAGALALIVVFAGYRLYEKDRAETAAELVRIRAYLEARAQDEAASGRQRAKPPAAERVVAAASAAAPPEPAAAVAPRPRALKATPAASVRPKRAEARAKPVAVGTKSVDARSPQPQVKASPAPVRTAERPKSVDRLWRERTARECAAGFVGFICREWLKFELCREHDAWGKASVCPAAEKPPPSVMSGSLG